jgi:PhnB protein
MAKIHPHLRVSNGKAVIELYKEVFGAKLVEHRSFSKKMGKNFGLSENFDYDNSTLHATLNINGAEITLADNFRRIPRGSTIDIVLDLDSMAQIEDIYKKAKERGFKINMELGKAFWGGYTARFEDSEGIGWQLNFMSED